MADTFQFYYRPPGGAWVNASHYVDARTWPMEDVQQADGQLRKIKLGMLAEVSGSVVATAPDGGYEGVVFKINGAGAVTKYIFGGVLLGVRVYSTTQNKRWTLEIHGCERELNLPIAFMAFDPTISGQRYDSERVNYLFANAGLTTTWDAVSYVGGPQVDYNGAGVTGFYRKNVYQILSAIAGDPGPAGNVAPRQWWTHVEWTAGIVGGSLTRFLHYYSSATVARETTPLTDGGSADLYANWAADDFNRANSSTALGTVTTGSSGSTGQTWSALNSSVWGINSNRAYLVSAPGGLAAAVVDASTANGDAQVTIAVMNASHNPRLVFRATAGGTGGVQCWFVQATAAGYELQWYPGSGLPAIASYATTPQSGDRIRVTLAGNVITVYLKPSAGAETQIMQHTDTLGRNTSATLYGLSANTVVTCRFDDFSVRAPAPYTHGEWERELDYTGMVNAIPIQGPGADPTDPTWQNATGVNAQGGSVVKTGTFNAWDAGAVTVEKLTEDGGYVTASVQQHPLASDGFDREDNAQGLGSAPLGGDWTPSGAPTEWRILNNQARPFGTSGHAFNTLDIGGATAIVQATLATAAGGAELVFRAQTFACNNCWFIRAEPGVGYRLYKRQVAVDSSPLASYATTPTNGDVLKVECTGDDIKFYLNGVYRFTYSDAFQHFSTRCGLGAKLDVSGAQNTRWDNFSVWSAYSERALGLGTATSCTSYASMPYCLLLKANSTHDVQIWESGVQRSISATTYAYGDLYKIEARSESVSGVQRVVVRYWKKASSDADYRLIYQSAVYPTPTGAAPLYGQVAIYDPAGMMNGVTIRRFTYGLYTDAASIAQYGIFYAKDLLKDDTLDSNQKRLDRATAIFKRHAAPRDMWKVKTMQEYGLGNRVCVTSSRLGWTDVFRVIAEKKVDRRESDNLEAPVYQYILGDSPREWMDDEPLGYLLRAETRDRTAPPVPSGLALGATLYDSEVTCNQEFLWTQTRADEEYIEIKLERVGTNEAHIYRLGAETNRGIAPRLPFSTVYMASHRARDYNNNVSDWSSAIEVRTPSSLQPAPPTDLAVIKSGINMDGTGWVTLGWTHSTYQQRSHYEAKYVKTNDTVYGKYVRVAGQVNSVTIDRLAADGATPYTFQVRTIASNVYPGKWSDEVAITLPPVPIVPDMGGRNIDVSHPDITIWGWRAGALNTAAGAAARSTTEAYRGLSSIALLATSGEVAEQISLPEPVVAGQAVTLYMARKGSSSPAANGTATFRVRFYNKAGAQIGSDTTVWTSSVTSSWVENYVKLDVPANAVYMVRSMAWSGATTGTLYVMPMHSVETAQSAKQWQTKSDVSDPRNIYDYNGKVRGVEYAGSNYVNIRAIRGADSNPSGMFLSDAGGNIIQFAESIGGSPAFMQIQAVNTFDLSAAGAAGYSATKHTFTGTNTAQIPMTVVAPAALGTDAFRITQSGNLRVYVDSAWTMHIEGDLQVGVNQTSGKVYQTGDGEGVAELVLEVVNDEYGASRLILQNRSGANGAIFQMDPDDRTVQLVDFAFQWSDGDTGGVGFFQNNLRIEGRSGETYMGNSGEFQFIHPGGLVFVMNSNGSRSLASFGAIVEDALTTGASEVYVAGHNSTGAPSTAFGGDFKMQLESSTTANQETARMRWEWATATHASRKGRWTLGVYDAATVREVIRVEADAVKGKLSFFGGSAQAQPSAYTQTYSTANRTLAGYTTNIQNSSYIGMDKNQSGSVYAAVNDLNTLRQAYENLRGSYDSLIQFVNSVVDDLQGYGLLQ